MSRYLLLSLLSLSLLVSYLFSISPLTPYLPQFLAAIAILFIIFRRKKSLLPPLASLIINSLVLTTHGLSSPFFFLIYFLLFTLAFQNPPSITLAFSLLEILFLSQSLNSLSSLIPLLSLALITPLSWFIGRLHLENQLLDSTLSDDETDILLWLSLKFKASLSHILDSTSILLSDTRLSPTQKEELNKIKKESKAIIKSATNLAKSIDLKTDES